MGGRKKTGKKEKKLRTYAIPKVFDCEKCSADQTLTVAISKKQNKKEAKIYCTKCKHVTLFQDVGALESAVDVYNRWCEALQTDRGKGNAYDDDEEGDIDDIDDLDGYDDEN